MSIETKYLENVKALFPYYKSLGEKAMEQVEEKRLFWVFNNESNSIGIIVQHLSGNMLSRFTRFFEEDGEKPWRNRDKEFESILSDRNEINEAWQNGWTCVLNVLEQLTPADLERIVYIRNEGHTVMEALNRQLAHYAYHVGQIVFLSKMVAPTEWKSLSIPKNKSGEFNQTKFESDKQNKNFI